MPILLGKERKVGREDGKKEARQVGKKKGRFKLDKKDKPMRGEGWNGG